MVEEWKDIDDFQGYQVSNLGRVRSFWKKKRRPTGYGCDRVLENDPSIMHMSDDGNGYLKLMLYNHKDSNRYCKKVHKLVAEAFIPKPSDDRIDYTVDHIRSGQEGKLDNSVSNLRWMSRSDNIKKAYRDGMCDARIAKQRVSIIMTDTWTGEECYFSSVTESSEMLRINYSTICHSMDCKFKVRNRFYFEHAGREEDLLYGDDDYKLLSWLRMGIL